MRVTQPADQEVFWHCWKLPPGLNRSDALTVFAKMKPSRYTFEKFLYDQRTGIARTV